ncbi:MAG: DUF4169 family protein [Alphaproteobacteria bacterium]|nr:DUF4169 family protein [Alphaproteobacteria bacterium]
MGEVVNLRAFRKAKARAGAEQLAEAHRQKFGRRKEDKELMQQIEALRGKQLDGHKREDDGEA